ncbi:hypothetical protein K505DRAFT_420562 [Melanomma pulvis-pyrius CBS 109.77]|uniref:Uncharacterized protein n=1 Tax=Melanomma pulvis-pyrius CBS 109.77 TaxID=1314802 RepID=A0A6A6WYK8_9PLEO|nr:hypothetical protein K505DRAFT_420562 [Melanomma pulvis-pyrius CBS 109.77]
MSPSKVDMVSQLRVLSRADTKGRMVGVGHSTLARLGEAIDASGDSMYKGSNDEWRAREARREASPERRRRREWHGVERLDVRWTGCRPSLSITCIDSSPEVTRGSATLDGACKIATSFPRSPPWPIPGIRIPTTRGTRQARQHRMGLLAQPHGGRRRVWMGILCTMERLDAGRGRQLRGPATWPWDTVRRGPTSQHCGSDAVERRRAAVGVPSVRAGRGSRRGWPCQTSPPPRLRFFLFAGMERGSEIDHGRLATPSQVEYLQLAGAAAAACSQGQHAQEALALCGTAGMSAARRKQTHEGCKFSAAMMQDEVPGAARTAELALAVAARGRVGGRRGLIVVVNRVRVAPDPSPAIGRRPVHRRWSLSWLRTTTE